MKKQNIWLWALTAAVVLLAAALAETQGQLGELQTCLLYTSYEEAVQYVYEAGLMQGTTGSTFSPDRASNRGMIAAILYRLEGRPRAGTPPFTDVAADSYCADAVAWAEQQGIVRGFDDGTFRPEGRITRQQLAAILFRYTEYRLSLIHI